MVYAAVPVFHFIGSKSERMSEELVSEANAHYRASRLQEFTNGLDGFGKGFRVTGAVGNQDAVWF